jgi:hypothetical protein
MNLAERLDPGAVDPVELPDERQHFGEFAWPVSLAALEHARDSTPGARQPGSFHPDH